MSDSRTKWKNRIKKNKEKSIQKIQKQKLPIEILYAKKDEPKVEYQPKVDNYDPKVDNYDPNEYNYDPKVEPFTDNENGFDFFVDNEKYYEECDDETERFDGNNKITILLELSKELIKLLLSPFTKSDKFIYEILYSIARIQHKVDCPEPDSNSNNNSDQNLMGDNVSGLWKKGDPSLQISNTEAEKMKESFDTVSNSSPNITLDITTLENPVKFYNIYKNLVSSFQENNSWITNDFLLKLYQYFQTDLIKYIKENNEFSDSEFLNYTNSFNTTLTDPTVVDKIKNIDLIPAWIALTTTILGNNPSNNFSFARKKNIITPAVAKPEETIPPAVQVCVDTDPNMKNKIKKDAQQMTQMLYQLCLIPVLLYMSYNFYYVLFFKKTTSQKYTEGLREKLDEIKHKMSQRPSPSEMTSLKTELDDIQDKFEKNVENAELDVCYDTTFKDWDEEYISFTKGFPIFFEYIFKPVHLLSIFLVKIKGWNKWASTDTNYYPFFAYLFTFVLIYLAFQYLYPEAKKIFTSPATTLPGYFCTGIVMLYYFYSMYQSYQESHPQKKSETQKGGADIASSVNTGSTILQNLAICFIWLIKGIIAYFFMGPVSTILLTLYIIILLLFGIYNENTTGSTNIEHINSYIYSSFFKESNIFKILCKYIFTYLFQIISILIIVITFSKYVNKFSDRISAILAIILGSIIVCIVGFCIVDFRNNEQKINEKYKNGGIRVINSCPNDNMQLLGVGNFIKDSFETISQFFTSKKGGEQPTTTPAQPTKTQPTTTQPTTAQTIPAQPTTTQPTTTQPTKTQPTTTQPTKTQPTTTQPTTAQTIPAQPTATLPIPAQPTATLPIPAQPTATLPKAQQI